MSLLLLGLKYHLTVGKRVAPGGSITGPNQVNQRQPSYVVNGQGEEEETEPMR